MKKGILLAGILAGVTFAGQFTGSVNVSYTNFGSSANEFDYRYLIKVKGQYKVDNGFFVKFGDTYQYWRYNDWLGQLGAKTNISVNVPFIQVGKEIDKFVVALGGFYVKADTEKLLADGSFDVNLTLEGKVNNELQLGLFNSYYRIANGGNDADIFQITPYVSFNYERFFGKVYLSAENIRADLGDETLGKVYARGGIDLGVRIIPQKLGLIAGGQIGKGWYWVNPNGEDIFPMARPQKASAYAGGYFKPFTNRNLVLTATVNYEVWETIDKDKVD